MVELSGLWISEDGTRAMRIARDLRVSVWRRRGGLAHLTDAPATWHPPKDGAEASDRARDRLGFLRIETGDPGLGSTYDLMVATARTGPGRFDWVRAPGDAPRAALRLFPEGGASFYEAVLGVWDDVVEAIRGGDRWMQPLSTWRPAEGEHEATDLDTAAALLAKARALRGVHFDALTDRSARAVRIVSASDGNPKPLARLRALEALAVDLVTVTPELVSIASALPKLAALELSSAGPGLVDHRSGFRALELLSLPHVELDLARLEPALRALPALHTLRLAECQAATLPPFVAQLARLARLDLTGVPVPEAELAALKAARPDLAITTSPVSLGWDKGKPGVLRIPDGFPVPDVVPDLDFLSGFRVALEARQVTVHVHWQESPADHLDHQTEIHGPVPVEDFVRQGPPIRLRPWDRAQLRRQLEAGLTGTSS